MVLDVTPGPNGGMCVTKNMGTADRIIRAALALSVAGLFFTGRISGTVALVLSVFAVVFLFTSLVGSCPGYALLGISTRGKPSTGAAPGRAV